MVGTFRHMASFSNTHAFLRPTASCQRPYTPSAIFGEWLHVSETRTSFHGMVSEHGWSMHSRPPSNRLIVSDASRLGHLPALPSPPPIHPRRLLHLDRPVFASNRGPSFALRLRRLMVPLEPTVVSFPLRVFSISHFLYSIPVSLFPRQSRSLFPT